jgi:hypothetical protein
VWSTYFQTLQPLNRGYTPFSAPVALPDSYSFILWRLQLDKVRMTRVWWMEAEYLETLLSGKCLCERGPCHFISDLACVLGNVRSTKSAASKLKRLETEFRRLIRAQWVGDKGNKFLGYLIRLARNSWAAMEKASRILCASGSTLRSLDFGNVLQKCHFKIDAGLLVAFARANKLQNEEKKRSRVRIFSFCCSALKNEYLIVQENSVEANSNEGDEMYAVIFVSALLRCLSLII